MNDVFSMLSTNQDTEIAGYGMSGDMKKTQYILELVGEPHDPDTLTCVLAAAEQGMEMDCYSISNMPTEQVAEGISKISPFSITPCLREADYIVCGWTAITEFINARGLGYSLSPQNAMLAAIQNYWVSVARQGIAQPVRQLIDELINKKRTHENYLVGIETIDHIYKQLSAHFSLLDQQLENNKFIVCNKYTLADLHWTVYIHFCELLGCEELISECRNINKWYQSIKVRKSSCGQNLVAYDCLPTLEQMLLGELNVVRMSDF